LAASWIPSPNAGTAPAASITTSAPRPPVSSRTRPSRSSGDETSARSIVAVAPRRVAISSLAFGAPMTITSRAPDTRASSVAARPTGPQPCTTTVWFTAMPPSRSSPMSIVGIAQPKAITASEGVSSGIR
jgi:hypothetical protein